jgi:hypothetical protein
MQTGTVEQFGSRNYPFYSLHAKLYLLLALARLAQEDVQNLLKHVDSFVDTALRGLPHVLIQRTAAAIALAIEHKSAGILASSVVKRLQEVGRSALPPREVSGAQTNVDTSWHIRGEIDKNLRFYFGMDFERYWFSGVARVFGISEEQTTELARQVVVEELHAVTGDEYRADPRRNQWQSGNDGGGTWHSHRSYPRVHDHTFYQAYHTLMCVSAKLLKEMPVVRQIDYGSKEDRWSEWLEDHSLVRSDGRWLADRRDPSPLKRRKWVAKSNATEWLWNVSADDFFDVVYSQSSRPGFLCVGGEWTEFSQDRVELIRVKSALVDPTTSLALAEALRTSPDPYGHPLPAYLDSEASVGLPGFRLMGWIREHGTCGENLDSFDPYAMRIDYPSEVIGQTFLQQLGLAVDSEQREWRLKSTGDLCAYAEAWSERSMDNRNSPCCNGTRLSASVALLKKLCSKLKMNLICEVQISRHYDQQYRSQDSEERFYYPPWHKIFLISKDGILRDAQTDHHIG